MNQFQPTIYSLPENNIKKIKHVAFFAIVLVLAGLAGFAGYKIYQLKNSSDVKHQPEAFIVGLGGGDYICSWHRYQYDENFYTICEGKDSPNGKDGVTTQDEMGYCQMQQDDSEYDPNCDCNGCSKKVTWRFKGPEGETCTYAYNYCNGNETDTCNGENEQWDFAKCTKCKNLQADWDAQTGTLTINNIEAENWHPKMDQENNDTKIQYPDSYVDFLLRIYEDGNKIKEQNIMGDSSQVSCTYNTTDNYDNRDSTNHYLTCTLENYTISNLNLSNNHQYLLRVWVKAHFKDSSAWREYNICKDTFSPTASPSPSPSPSPSSSPPAWLICKDLTKSKSNLKIGDIITFTCIGESQGVDINHYEFRLSKDGGKSFGTLSNDDKDGILEYQIESSGEYLVECRVCSTTGGNHCTVWGEVNDWTP